MNPEKRKKLGSWILFGTIVLLTVAEWNVYAWYEAVTPYGTLIASLGLLACFFVCVNVKDALKDPVFYLMAGTDLMALINIFLVNSGIGALLTIADFLLICYLANKMEMSEKMILLTSAYFAFFFFYWTIDVKGYFKGYNTNYGGLILVTGLSFLMILFAYIREYLSKKEGGRIRTYRFLLYLCQASMIVLGFDIIAWYRSRCALIGFLTLLLVILIPKKWWRAFRCGGASVDLRRDSCFRSLCLACAAQGSFSGSDFLQGYPFRKGRTVGGTLGCFSEAADDGTGQQLSGENGIYAGHV